MFYFDIDRSYPTNRRSSSLDCLLISAPSAIILTFYFICLPFIFFFFFCSPPLLIFRLTSPSSSDLCLPSSLLSLPCLCSPLFTSSFQPFAFCRYLHILLSLSHLASSPPPLVQQPVRPARLLQAPPELLGHDITHPAAAAADAGAASGAGAAGAAETAGLPVPTNHGGTDPCHQCQCPDQFTASRPGPNGGAQGKLKPLVLVCG